MAKVGLTAVASESAAALPAGTETMDQEKSTTLPLGSVVPLPSRVTVAPTAKVWSKPASATGGGLPWASAVPIYVVPTSWPPSPPLALSPARSLIPAGPVIGRQTSPRPKARPATARMATTAKAFLAVVVRERVFLKLFNMIRCSPLASALGPGPSVSTPPVPPGGWSRDQELAGCAGG